MTDATTTAVQGTEKNPSASPQANTVNVADGVTVDNFVPMSVPQARLQVPPRAGWHRHWIRNEPGRIERALNAGYQFVDQSDVHLPSRSLGGPPEESGNSDLGSRVSIAAGGYTDGGQAQRLFLMECPLSLYERAQAMLQKVNDGTVEALSAGQTGRHSPQDRGNTYVKGSLPDLFQKKT